MNNWKFHLKCLAKGLGVYIGIALGIGAFLWLVKNHPRVIFITLMTPLVLLGAYCWGRGLEGK
jgi:hypothetical protein